MAKLRSFGNGKKKNGAGIANLVGKLQKSFFIGRNNNNNNRSFDEFEEVNDSMYVPEDVKEGHFAVVAVESEEPKRFVVPLSYLAHPRFQRLLEQAAEEYGFNQEGTLTIPCGPFEIERILADQKWGRETNSSSSSSSSSRADVDKSWDSCNSSMLPIC